MSELDLSTDEARVSYGIGRQMGDQLRQNPPPGISIDAVVAGLRAAFNGEPMLVSGEELNASFTVIRERMEAEAAVKAQEAAAEGIEFLKENAKKDGVITLASGLQYEVLNSGDGAQPTRESTERKQYHGTINDGSLYDSS